MPTKPSYFEKEFFAKEELEKRHKLQKEKNQKQEQKSREELKKLHFMKCPKCGDDLKTVRYNIIDIEQCGHCGAIVLDKGELEKLKVADNVALKAFVDLFKEN